MKTQPKKEIKRTVTHKGTMGLQKVEREKRLKTREERREWAISLQRGMNTRVTDQEINPPKSGHDHQEEGVDEEASPMEEYLWIEQREALQLEISQEARPLSLTNLSTQIQVIVEEDQRLRLGEFSIWSQLNDEVNEDNHLVICGTKEGNWVTLQEYPSN